mmetsp:Transcript_7838/g.8972  ORF Transcript_7838/g.8972 Transcript_7838/m.8972 type:complete len:138 (+) Transcript_7838:96-509(+)
MWKNGKIVCPNCKAEYLVAGMKDLPHTNFSLLILMQNLKTKQGYEKVADKYKIADVDNLLKIKESIERKSDPKILILEGIYGSETIYKEEVLDLDDEEPRLYSVNKGSWTRNYLDIRIEHDYLGLLRKYSSCRHKYS